MPHSLLALLFGSAAPAHDDPFGVEALRLGWARVRANRGAAGPDGVEVADFERHWRDGVAHLADEVRTGRYEPGGVRRAPIEKANGKLRWLAIPNVRDRIVQTAAARRISRIADPAMSRGSFGYRPRRSVAMALREVRRARRDGRAWILDADIETFFDSAPHARVLKALDARAPRERRLRQLVALWLASADRSKVGLAQGSPVSPVLANLLLDPLDRDFEAMGRPAIRYADDFVVPVRSAGEAKAALATAQRRLARLGLRLNAAKTHVRAPRESFDFLGERVSGVKR